MFIIIVESSVKWSETSKTLFKTSNNYIIVSLMFKSSNYEIYKNIVWSENTNKRLITPAKFIYGVVSGKITRAGGIYST